MTQIVVQMITTREDLAAVMAELLPERSGAMPQRSLLEVVSG